MARIKKENLKIIMKERNSIHQDTQCTYSALIGEDGEQYFQLDTYGTSGRKIPGKASQSIQFDKDTAKSIIALLNKYFKNEQKD